MVTKKRSGGKAAPRRRSYAARGAAPRRRSKKSGIPMIPGAAATLGLFLANKDYIVNDVGYFVKYGVSKGVNSVINKKSWKKYMTVDQLAKDAIYTAGGYVAGEVAKKYAPGVIKRPLGKLAKKIPKVFD